MINVQVLKGCFVEVEGGVAMLNVNPDGNLMICLNGQNVMITGDDIMAAQCDCCEAMFSLDQLVSTPEQVVCQYCMADFVD